VTAVDPMEESSALVDSETDHLESLVRRCLDYLDQAVVVTRSVPADRYSESVGSISPASVGAHIRHCHDFFQRLVSGIETGRVEYELRERDHRVEIDRDYAAAKLTDIKKDLVAALEGLTGTDEITVRLEHSKYGDGDTRSTIARELDVACSHTVHHFGIAALLMRAMELDVPPEFGVAPSTSRYRGVDVE